MGALRHGDRVSVPPERDRLIGLLHSVTADLAVRDADAYIDYLLALPETAGASVGTTGYCGGGRLSLIVAGHLGDRIAAAASFHGGNVAAADDPESPHRRAESIAATVYVAGATNDASFPDEQRDRLEAALTASGVRRPASGVRHTILTYPAAHGFAVADNATYDAAAAGTHWDALTRLYADALDA